MIPDGRARTLHVAPTVQLREIAYPAGYRQGVHHHATSSVTLLLSGELTERAGSTVERAHALSVVVKPAGTEHDDRVGEKGSLTVQLVLRPDVLERGAPGDWRWYHNGRAARAFLRFLAGPHNECAVFELLAEIGPIEVRPTTPPPRWVRTVATEIDDTFAAGPRVRALAERAGVHPVSLARAFRRHFGTSITERIRQRRLQRVAGLLGGSDTPLSVVAHSAGFTDQSHMHRVFRRATGLTPGRYRTLAGR